MLTMTLKNRVWRESKSFSDLFSKKRKLVIQAISCVFLLEIIWFLFLIKYMVFSDTNQYVSAATALAATTHTDLKLGLATEQFVNELKGVGLKPILDQKIQRMPFSVKGSLISLNRDNIQVFEYSDHGTASKEGAIFSQKYTKDSTKNKWNNIIHLYVRDKIVIFYMGKDINILKILSKNEELNLTDIAFSK